jgi:hypothetical protein
MPSILTPYARGKALQTGKKLFRKMLLPVGEIEYEGQRVKFDRPFLQTLVASFDSGAYDQVPFQLADSRNGHTNDPERFRGEVESLELGSDGLYMTVSTTSKGANVISENPQLGVSARIVNGLKRADGKFFPAAIQHALGTLDPRITGMGPWEAVEMSNPGEVVIDLTGTEYLEDSVAPQLSEDELTRLRALLAPETEPDTDDLTEDELNALIEAADDLDSETEVSEDEINALIEAEGLSEVTAAVDPRVQHALELSNTQLRQQAVELARVTSALDAGRFEQERDMFMRQYGIPPAVLDMARPLLEGDGHVIALSNGQSEDAGAVVRRVLTEIGQQIKLLDLSVELGSSVDGDERQAENEGRMALVKNFRSAAGI